MAQKKKTNRIGNKQNSYLNDQWVRHTDKFGKKLGSHIRRMLGKLEIKDRLENE